MDKLVALSFESGSVNGNKSAASPTSLNVSTSDASAIYYTYTALGRRLLFRPMFRPVYKDAEDYYRQSYDPAVGIRVAVVLGSLMIFVCGIAVYNRYGFFRKRRKLNVSVGNSLEELEGIEWLQKMHQTRMANASPDYSPKHSDQDVYVTCGNLHKYAPKFSTSDLSLSPRTSPLRQGANFDTASSVSFDVLPSDICSTNLPDSILVRSNSY